MKPAVHQFEDKLLEFAYGELQPHEAEAVDAHVRGCTRCAESLSQMTAVRQAMQALPNEPAPADGLDSLLAFAEQHAARNASTKAAPWWRRAILLASPVMALLVVGVVSLQVSRMAQPDPVAAAFSKAEAEAIQQKKEERAALPVAQAQAEERNKAPQAPGAVAATPPVEPAADKEYAAEKQADDLKGLTLGPSKTAALGKVGYGAGNAPSALGSGAAAAPKIAKRNSKSFEADYSNVGTRSREMNDGTSAKQAMEGNSVSTGIFGLSTGTGTRGGGKADLAVAGPTGGAGGTAPLTETAATAPGRGPGTASAPVAVKPAPRQVAKKDRDDEPMYYGEAKKPVAEPAAPAPAAVPPQAAAAYDEVTPSALQKPKDSLAFDAKSKLARSEESVAEDEQKVTGVGTGRDAETQRKERAANLEGLLASARSASNRGDRQGELKLSLVVLNDGAEGYQRAEALKRVCDAYDALGRPDSAEPYCAKLLAEFGSTAAAQQVAQRRSAVRLSAPELRSSPKKKAAKPPSKTPKITPMNSAE